MNIIEWTNSEVDSWLHENNAMVSLCYGKAKHFDGNICKIAVESPHTHMIVVGSANQARNCIEQCIKGLEYQKKNKGEYLVEKHEN